MNEPLILLLQRLQNTIVPAILAGTGSILIIASVVGAFWKREMTPRRRKGVGCFGFFILLSSILFYGVPLLLHTYSPTLTFGEIFTFIKQSLVLLLRGLQNTPIPPILAGSGSIIIIVSIVGIFGRHRITRKQTLLAACFGVFLLSCGAVSYEVPLFLPQNVNANHIEETLKIPVSGRKGVTTKLAYHGTTTITITGEAKKSDVAFSDAFYLYGSSTFHPVHSADYTIWINGKPIDAYIKSIPLYEKDHTYTFKINAPGGNLIFSVGTGLATDKIGYFTIILS